MSGANKTLQEKTGQTHKSGRKVGVWVIVFTKNSSNATPSIVLNALSQYTMKVHSPSIFEPRKKH